MAEIILNFDGNGDEKNVAQYSNICSGRIINTSISNAWDGVSFSDKGNGFLAINVPKNPSSTKGRKTEAVISYSTSDGFICETHTVLLCQKNSNGGSKTYTYGTASVTKTVNCSGGNILLSTDRMPYTATTSGGETETGYTSASLNVSVAECTEPTGCTTSSRGTATPGGTIEYTIEQNGCGSLCNCDKLIVNEIGTIPYSGGTYTAATYDNCISNVILNTSSAPTGMITTSTTSNGYVIVTFGSNSVASQRPCTCSLTYSTDSGSCPTESLSFTQEAAPSPKAVITLSNGTQKTIYCNDNDTLTAQEINNAAGSNNVVTAIVVKDCVKIIGERLAYDHAGSLTSFTMTNNVTEIGESAFYGCNLLNNVTFSTNLTTIGVTAFRGCDGLTKVELPNSVTTLGYDAFHLCDNLAEVIIGTGFTGATCGGALCGRCFEQTGGSLMKLTCKATTPPDIKDRFFCYESTKISGWLDGFKIYVPRNSVDAYRRNTNWSYYADVIEPIS